MFLQTDKDTLSLDAADGSQAIMVITSSTNWNITVPEDNDWITINPVTGIGNTSVTITATKNTHTSERTSIITISGSNVDPITVVIVQKGVPSTLQIFDEKMTEIHYNDTLIIPSDSGTVFFSVKNNADDWSIQDNALWLQCIKTNDTLISVSYTENIGCSGRSTDVTVTNTDGKIFKFFIEQGIDTSTCINSVDNKIFAWARLYPNPAEDYVYLEIGDLSVDVLRITIINTTGKIVYINKFPNFPPNGRIFLNIQRLPEGIYFIHIISGNKNKVLKLLKKQ